MKILMFTSVLSGGGAERVLCELANNFCFENNVILVSSYKTENEYFINENVKKIYIDNSIESKNTLLQIVNLRKVIKKEQPDICLSFLPHPNYKMLIASLGTKSKKIISVRNDPKIEYAGIKNKIISKILYPLADGVVFQTKEAQKYFSANIQKKSLVIMNQVDKKFFNFPRKNKKYWIATGRLNSQKNYPMMINAFKRIVEIYPNEKLYIFGKGELRNDIENLIKDLGLENNVILKGQTNDVVDALSHAKGFLLSSNYEGMPNGLLEAHAMGVPCISTDCPCGGPKEVIINLYNGILTKVGDEENFFQAIKMLCEDDKLMEKISKNSKIESKKYESNQIFEKWNNFFYEVYKK